MNAKISIAVVVMCLFLVGCGEKCDEPYKLINDMCCTDENANSVCDVDELPQEAPALKEMDESLYGEADPLRMPEYDMPAPKLQEPVEIQPEIKAEYNVKQTTVASKGMTEAKPAPKEPEFEFNVSNLRYGFGMLNRFDIDIKNVRDVKLEPRVHVYAIQEGEYNRVQVVYLDPLWPGQERIFDDLLINADIDAVDQKVKFEIVYHTLESGLVTVGYQEIPVTRREIRS